MICKNLCWTQRGIFIKIFLPICYTSRFSSIFVCIYCCFFFFFISDSYKLWEAINISTIPIKKCFAATKSMIGTINNVHLHVYMYVYIYVCIDLYRCWMKYLLALLFICLSIFSDVIFTHKNASPLWNYFSKYKFPIFLYVYIERAWLCYLIISSFIFL